MTLADPEALPACPGCGGDAFERMSLFGSGRFARRGPAADTTEEAAVLAAAAEMADQPGHWLAWEDGARTRVISLDRDWTRIGRSLAADVRLDDPTVSRRHALIVRGPDGLRVLDDRSLNGVFVNGERVEWRMLCDGDVIAVGRHRLYVLERSATGARPERPVSSAGG